MVLCFWKRCIILPIVVLKKLNFKWFNVFSADFHDDDFNESINFFLANKSQIYILNIPFSLIYPIINTDRIDSLFFCIAKHDYVLDFISDDHIPPIMNSFS